MKACSAQTKPKALPFQHMMLLIYCRDNATRTPQLSTHQRSKQQQQLLDESQKRYVLPLCVYNSLSVFDTSMTSHKNSYFKRFFHITLKKEQIDENHSEEQLLTLLTIIP